MYLADSDMIVANGETDSAFAFRLLFAAGIAVVYRDLGSVDNLLAPHNAQRGGKPVYGDPGKPCHRQPNDGRNAIDILRNRAGIEFLDIEVPKRNFSGCWHRAAAVA